MPQSYRNRETCEPSTATGIAPAAPRGISRKPHEHRDPDLFATASLLATPPLRPVARASASGSGAGAPRAAALCAHAALPPGRPGLDPDAVAMGEARQGRAHGR